MRVLTLFIPGEFEDAFVYMGRIVALTRDRALRFYHFDALVQSLVATARSPLLTHLFVRNDWLTSEAFSTLLTAPEVRVAVGREFERLPSVMQLPTGTETGLIEVERDLGLRDHLVLDLQIYNKRLYLSAGSGFYHVDPDWSSLPTWRRETPTKRHDGRSMSSTAGYGSVNVSCGDDGLFTVFDEFHWASPVSTGGFDRTALRSLRAVWSGVDLINYSTATTPELLRSQAAPTAEHGADRERRLLTAFGANRIDLTDVLRNAITEFGMDTSDTQFIFNSNKNLFLYTLSGHLFVVGLTKDAGNGAHVSFARIHDALPLQVLGMHSSRSGIVLEAENGVWLFNEDQWFNVYQGAALTVRTFPRSKRYRNLILVTGETGITIISPTELAGQPES